MKLFLLRHSIATNTYPDEERKLTESGYGLVEKLCSFLKGESFANLSAIWHSPYLRAFETACAFKENLLLNVPLIENEFLTPCSNPEHVASAISKLSHMNHDLMIVGHNPHLELLASCLMGENKSYGSVVFDRCTLAILQLSDYPNATYPYDIWQLETLVSPNFLQ